MAFLEYPIIDLFPIVTFVIWTLIVLYRRRTKNSIIPTNWPILGTIPAGLVNIHRLHEYSTAVLACSGGTFLFKGSKLAKMDLLCTTNPLDIHHIMSKNFPNYPKGKKFRKIFDILGDGFSNSDGELWEFHRRTLMFLLKHPCLQSIFEKTVWNKVEKGLLPVLQNLSSQRMEVDLQDVFQRFGFDIVCQFLFDYDPESMSLKLPYIPCEKALTDVEEAIFRRHIMPARLWKWQRLLGMGNEKKMSDAWKAIDQFIYTCLAQKQEDFSNTNYEPEEEKFSFLTSLMKDVKEKRSTLRDPNKFLRDILLNLMVAGRDTTSSALSWFFYLLAKNPLVEDKILAELHTQLDTEKNGRKCMDFHAIELCKLVYLHGALCEALRLFPPIPFQHKIPLQSDILPSGHQVDRNTTIILCFYTMGRMKSLWGEDCMEFKPERWLSLGGGIKHQPSYKFPAFNAGPRACLGKDLSFVEMKIVATIIIYHYHVELIAGHRVFPSDSITLHMKNGLKVMLTKRSEVEV